ncbi:MAG: D-aminoacyl-tRNA deacylase [Candidatus Melainabacteria bacterium]
MKCVIQRVQEARVVVDDATVGEIGAGMLVLVGFERGDTEASLAYPVDKLGKLRIFADEDGKMNRSVQDVGGRVLVVSQFTLAGDCRKGTRPGFDGALPPQEARALYAQFVEQLQHTLGAQNVATGQFGAHMAVSLINDGPVTFLLEN